MDEKVRKFAERFADALEADSWGEIDPDLFREIADAVGPGAVGDLSEDAHALMLALSTAL